MEITFLLQMKQKVKQKEKWVDVAISSNLEVLKMFCTKKHKIVNLETKELVYIIE